MTRVGVAVVNLPYYAPIVLAKLLTTIEGDFYRVPRSRVEPRPVQKPHPPLLLGGTAEGALRRAGRVAAGWISSSRTDLNRIDRSIAIVRTAAMDAGRDPDELRFVCRGVVKIAPGRSGHHWSAPLRRYAPT
ncbi:MAG: LLM class flavin-dependent oxidoreductase [Actinomycetota bacterium]